MDQQPVNTLNMDKVAVIREYLRLFEFEAHKAGLSYADTLMIANRYLVIAQLDRHGWHQCKTAHALKMHRNTLAILMERLNITKRPIRKSAAKVEQMLALSRFRRA